VIERGDATGEFKRRIATMSRPSAVVDPNLILAN
jgi:hypothetical protein